MASLLLKFRDKDSPYGVSRDTLRTIAGELNMSETTVVHMALARLARDVLPGYEADDGPLSADELAEVRTRARASMPKGKLISTKRLL